MRRRGARSRRALIGGGFLALLVVLIAGLSIKSYRTPPAAPPAALERIGEKNRDAATRAAAHQRAESAASANAADRRIEAEENGASANAL
ncbi:MAG TPA: hypothetical protein VGW40_14300 [Allosphingosinicella sp.]|nr:hypothetical protein [Allosphingosinicella sp.]